MRIMVPLLAGVALGYSWHAYYPAALPLDAYASSEESSSAAKEKALRQAARTAEERARKAELRQEELEAKLRELAEDQERTERELGDLQIKSVLKSETE